MFLFYCTWCYKYNYFAAVPLKNVNFAKLSQAATQEMKINI